MKSFLASELAARLEGAYEGPADLVVDRWGVPEACDKDSAVFAEIPELLQAAEAVSCRLIVVDQALRRTDIPSIRVADLRSAMATTLELYDDEDEESASFAYPGIHPNAILEENVKVGANSSIGNGTVVGKNVVIYPNVYVGPNCVIGEGTVLFPSVTIYRRCRLGVNCRIHAGSVIGADGFGYIPTNKGIRKLRHVGEVHIGNGVEIGANSCVDRATLGATVIEDNVKLDNLVQIAHNCSLGEDTLIAALVGISGSSKIGKRVRMGGQCATVDHCWITDDVALAARSAVVSKIEEPGAYFGAPPLPIKEGLRVFSLQSKLPDLLQRIRALEKKSQL